jgi:hypothetical protein
MKLKRALELLKIYGDHRFKCIVQKKIMNHAGYGDLPWSDCGWKEVQDHKLKDLW